jgi:hypothetical protein
MVMHGEWWVDGFFCQAGSRIIELLVCQTMRPTGQEEVPLADRNDLVDRGSGRGLRDHRGLARGPELPRRLAS